MSVLTLILGFLFGASLQYAGLNKFNTISGPAIGKNFAVAKAIPVAIGLGAILINVEIGMNLASYHAKPLVLGGITMGGFFLGQAWPSGDIVPGPCCYLQAKDHWMPSLGLQAV